MENNGDLRKLIYVDDLNYHLLSFISRFQNQYEVYPAQSAEKMFEILERVKPDLILLDVNMPDVNGFEAIEKMKADKRYADIPVIFLTSQHDKESIVKGMTLGAVDFIAKPFSDKDLIEGIEYQFDDQQREAIKPVILAIDDNPSILQAVNSLLENQYTVYTVPNVASEQMLKDLLRKISPDLFLLDYNMPGLTGFDLIPLIRKIPGHDDTPIVFLTSEGTVDNISAAMYMGACDFITKPIDEKVLRTRIATHLADFIMWRRVRSQSDK